MPFWKLEKGKQPKNWDEKCALRLRRAAIKRFPMRRNGTWDLTKSAHEFRLLRTELNQDKARIETVLNWYVDFLISSRSPENVVYSAGSFRKHFLWIEQQYNTDRNKQERISPDLLQEYLEVHEIERLLWPEEIQEQVREFIAETLANYLEYYERARDLYRSREAHDDHGFLICEFWMCLADPHTFVPGWVQETHQMVHMWEDWSGSLKGLAFNAHSKRYTRMMLSFVESLTGCRQDWFHLLEKMGYASAN